MAAAEFAWSAASLLIALIAGKFIAIASLRMPAGQEIAWSRSACAQCKRAFALAGMLPALGYALHRGHCPACAAPMPKRDAALQLISVAVAAWALAVHPGPFGALTSVMGWWLLLIAAIDWEHFWLPNRLTFPLGLFGLITAAFVDPARWGDRIIGAGAGFLVLSAIAVLYRRLRGHEGLGGGDPRLLAAGGAWVGWIGLPSVLIWASAAGLAVVAAKILRGGRIGAGERVPFGTYLALGIWLAWLYGPLGGGL